MSRPVVVKIGGSLLDLPDLKPRLRHWLMTLSESPVVCVPGGGPTADVVRRFDSTHQLGEETAHWLALRSLALNARLVAKLIDGDVALNLAQCRRIWRRKRVAVLDAMEFSRADERESGHLPHVWSATSDSIAARFAAVAEAGRLILLKSVAPPSSKIEWWEASGFVDELFSRFAARSSAKVEAINFREIVPVQKPDQD